MGKARQRTATVVDGIDAIAELGRDELIADWIKAYGRHPPKGISRVLLERSAAYHLQAEAHGSLDRATQRALHAALTSEQDRPSANRSKLAKTSLQPGVRLVREWNGRTHTVDVVEGGFVWNGRVHRSLSAIARQITGARWSGPRFFGL
jgi:hypothetical protein